MIQPPRLAITRRAIARRAAGQRVGERWPWSASGSGTSCARRPQRQVSLACCDRIAVVEHAPRRSPLRTVPPTVGPNLMPRLSPCGVWWEACQRAKLDLVGRFGRADRQRNARAAASALMPVHIVLEGHVRPPASRLDPLRERERLKAYSTSSVRAQRSRPRSARADWLDRPSPDPAQRFDVPGFPFVRAIDAPKLLPVTPSASTVAPVSFGHRGAPAAPARRTRADQTVVEARPAQPDRACDRAISCAASTA